MYIEVGERIAENGKNQTEKGILVFVRACLFPIYVCTLPTS